MSSLKFGITLYGIFLALVGLYMFGIGLWGLMKRRPLVFSERRSNLYTFAWIIPTTIVSIVVFIESRDSSFYVDLCIQSAIYSFLIFVFWRVTTGYAIFGVSDDAFHDALTFALNELHLPYEETISRIKLTGINADLQTIMTTWMGTAVIRIKPHSHIHYARNIANAMNEYFKKHAVKVNLIPFITFLLSGILGIFYFIWIWSKLH